MAGRLRRRNPCRRPAPRGEAGSLLHKAGVVLVVLVLAAAGAVQWGLVPTIGHDRTSAGPPGTGSPAGPALHLEPPPKAPDVLAVLTAGPPVSVARLRSHLAGPLALPALGRQVGFAVAQLGDPDVRWSEGAKAVTPASTLKLLTTTAALATLGPAHRFTTSVVQGATRGSLVLVGGGDPLLVDSTPTPQQARSLYPQPASLQRLAGLVAARLTSEGVRRVRLAFDASLFTGPAVNPRWPSTYISENVVSPISALWVNEGRTRARLAERAADPAQAAADAFRAQLTRAGITVTGSVQAEPQPPPPATVVASVSSAPLEEIVQHVLELSDNEGAEVLMRQVAIASGGPGSSQAGVTAVRKALTGLGVDLEGAVFYDGSGLSRQDLIPVQLLLQVIETAASPSYPALHGVITGLPVAGFSGSLGYRFVSDAQLGLGQVRAKTGTLTGVHALAGVAMTRRGQALAFVAVADRVSLARTLDARDGLDKIAAALATCGC